LEEKTVMVGHLVTVQQSVVKMIPVRTEEHVKMVVWVHAQNRVMILLAVVIPMHAYIMITVTITAILLIVNGDVIVGHGDHWA
jgi:hypothetical protein